MPIPEDITLISAGLLAGIGNISLTGGMIAGYVGVLVGDMLLFFIGRKFGRNLFLLPFFKTIFTPKRIAKAEEKIHKNAHIVCFTARFLPGLRAPIYLTAGILRVKPAVFIFQDGLAALLSVPIWIMLGYWVGDNLNRALEIAKEIQIYLFSGLFIFVLLYVLYKRRQSAKVPIENQI